MRVEGTEGQDAYASLVRGDGTLAPGLVTRPWLPQASVHTTSQD